MLQYYVLLLLINWPCVRSEVSQITPIPDQLTVASVQKSNFAKSKISSQHYDDFKPIVVNGGQYKNSNDSKPADLFENDPAYSTEARILFNLPGPSLNRRSFDSDSQYNEFELLKVTNNTPKVANYHDFYEDQYIANEETDPSEINQKKVRHKTQSTRENYPKHYVYMVNNKDSDRKVQESKVTKTYPRRDRQKSKFLQPVVVVEPATYKVDYKFGTQSVTTKLTSSTPIQQSSTTAPTKMDNSNVYSQEYSNVYSNKASTSRHYNNAEDSKETSDESMEYSDVTERSRKVSKHRRRPYDVEASKKLPKEHREVYEESYNAGESRKRYNANRAKQRYRNRNKHSWPEDDRYTIADESREHQDNKETWNQPDPNNDALQTSGFEVNQIEKPKLVPVVPLNILGSFDHATALGNSQGFDMSNVMLQNLASGATLVSTAAPLISTSHPVTRAKESFDLVNSVPDIIVGQSTIQTPIQTVLISQPNKQNMKTQFLQNTVTPIYAFSTTASPNSHGQSTTASKPIFAASTTVAPVQHLAFNSVQTGVPVNQLLVSQPTLHTLTNIGQSSIGNHHVQGQSIKPANLYQIYTPKNKDYVQNAQIVPAIVHTGVNLHTQSSHNQNSANPFAFSSKSKENAQILKATNEAFENSMRQLQKQILKNQGSSGNGYQSDTIGSTSNNNANVVNVIPNVNLERAQLPTLGTKNVEILNPNLKQTAFGLALTSPIGVLNQYPAVLTTPFPILSTTNFATLRPGAVLSGGIDQLGLHSYVDTLTELGSKINSANTQAVYNPIHFVPNLELLKSQSILNKGNDALQQGLNLVPSLPGGNFYKSNNDLATKPKLSSDLEKYAEEMLKESLRTIYNTHKWNNDRKIPRNVSLVDHSPAAKLRNELLRYKPLKESNRDNLEGHHTENKYHVVPGNKKPDFTMAKLEELLMNDFKLHPPVNTEPIHVYHHHGSRPSSGRPSDQGSSYSNTEVKHVKHEINDYLTPPKPNSFVSKSPFHDRPAKKRPAKYNKNEKGRIHTRVIPASKASGPEVAGSNNYEYNLRYDSYNRHHRYPEYRKRPRYDNFYPSLTTPFSDFSGERKVKDTLDVNHPRTHNLIGLLMKNNKLPAGVSQNYGHDDRDDLESLFNDERKSPLSHLDLSVFQKKSDVHPNFTTPNDANKIRVKSFIKKT